MAQNKGCRSVLWVLLVMVVALCGAGEAVAAEESASYDVAGHWLIEGEGYGKKNVRVQLELDGALDIRTGDVGGRRHITGYDLWLRIDATRLNIKAWSERYTETFTNPILLPTLRPTLNEPFALPPVKTKDGLVYEVTLNSVTSGTVKIYGTIDLDTIGATEINSESALWKEGTQKPDIDDLGRGCQVGAGWGSAFLQIPLMLRFGRRRRS